MVKQARVDAYYFHRKRPMSCSHFNQANFKHKMEKLVFDLEIILNKDIVYENLFHENKDINMNHLRIYQTNFKFFNFEIEDKTTIIQFFRNNGFMYTPTPELKDRLIFKYVTTLYE